MGSLIGKSCYLDAKRRGNKRSIKNRESEKLQTFSFRGRTEVKVKASQKNIFQEEKRREEIKKAKSLQTVISLGFLVIN